MATGRAFRISHIIVRVVSAINLAYFAAMTYPPYLHATAGGAFGRFAGTWSLISSLILPLYVAVEGWWMRGKTERRALWIDAAFAGLWFLVFWGAALYGLSRYSMP